MNLYAESSAVLAWLLGEPTGLLVQELLSTAASVFASDLTLVESDRVLIRSTVAGQISEAEAANRRAHLSRVSGHWNLVRISDEIVSRARRPFPVEPIRTLDALHLASALVVRAAEPELTMLSLDERVRDCTLALGLGLLPEQTSTSL